MNSPQDRLPRLLTLVPWLLANPGRSEAEIAAQFGVTTRQLHDDLLLLWMCGLPGQTPGDLIEIVWEGDRVTMTNADTIGTPLRLATDEALALVAALRSLSSTLGIVDQDAVDRALAKLESAAGDAAVAGAVLAASPPEADSGVAAAVAEALARKRRLHLSYWVPTRDEATERDVDPVRLFTGDAAAYLYGWCHRVEDYRTFRLDRILVATISDMDVAPHPAPQRETEVFGFTDDDRLVTLRLGHGARWVADYYPCESVEEQDGSMVVRLRARDDEWVRRLALGLGAAGQVVDPPELADAVRSAAADALALYG